MPVQLDFNFAVFGVSAILVIIKVVDILKVWFGITGKGSVLAALVVSAMLGIGNQLSMMNATFAIWFKVGFYIVFAAIGAMEGYDQIRARKENLEVAKVTAELLKSTARPGAALAERVEAATEPTAASTSEPVK